VTEPVSSFRSREQILNDLYQALHFSEDALDRNREGRLAAEQIKHLAVRCVRPALLASIFLFLPLFLWISTTAAQQQVDFLAAIPLFFDDFVHFSKSVEAHGRIGALFRLGTVLLSVGLGVFMASRFPLAMYFDLLDGTVYMREGRVIAREEQTLRGNGRDPIEKYFFDLKGDRFQVNLAAFRAIENGGLYTIYLLPRSQVLVAIEPKTTELRSKTGELLAG